MCRLDEEDEKVWLEWSGWWKGDWNGETKWGKMNWERWGGTDFGWEDNIEGRSCTVRLEELRRLVVFETYNITTADK